MNRKAQDLTQVLVYVISAIVFMLVLYFGWNAITYISRSTEDIQVSKIRQTLENTVERLQSMSSGSAETVRLSIPGAFSEICIIASRDRVVDLPALGSARPLMHRLWSRGDENIIFQPSASMPILIPGIDVPEEVDDDRYCCLRNVGRVMLRMEARPGFVAVAPADPSITPCQD